MLYLIQLPCWPLLDLPHITTSHHDHHGRGESSALNFSEKRSRAGMGASVDGRDRRLSVCRGRPRVVQAASPARPVQAEPFYNDFFCMLRLLQVWTRRWGQARDVRYHDHGPFANTKTMVGKKKKSSVS